MLNPYSVNKVLISIIIILTNIIPLKLAFGNYELLVNMVFFYHTQHNYINQYYPPQAGAWISIIPSLLMVSGTCTHRGAFGEEIYQLTLRQNKCTANLPTGNLLPDIMTIYLNVLFMLMENRIRCYGLLLDYLNAQT